MDTHIAEVVFRSEETENVLGLYPNLFIRPSDVATKLDGEIVYLVTNPGSMRQFYECKTRRGIRRGWNGQWERAKTVGDGHLSSAF